MLSQKHVAQLREANRGSSSVRKSASRLFDGETHNFLLGFNCDYDRLRRVVEAGVMQQASKVKHIFVSYSITGDIHGGEGTQSASASNRGRANHLDGSDPGLEAGVYARTRARVERSRRKRTTSMTSPPWKLLAAVLVELVDRIRAFKVSHTL